MARSGDGSSLAGLNVLLVEDEYLIALDTDTMLIEAQVALVITCSSCDSALAALEETAFDIAILDVMLGVERSEQVAEVLTARGIPFVLATGYPGKNQLGEAFIGAPIVSKPFGDVELRHAMVEALGRRKRASDESGATDPV